MAFRFILPLLALLLLPSMIVEMTYDPVTVTHCLEWDHYYTTSSHKDIPPPAKVPADEGKGLQGRSAAPVADAPYAPSLAVLTPPSSQTLRLAGLRAEVLGRGQVR